MAQRPSRLCTSIIASCRMALLQIISIEMGGAQVQALKACTTYDNRFSFNGLICVAVGGGRGEAVRQARGTELV